MKYTILVLSLFLFSSASAQFVDYDDDEDDEFVSNIRKHFFLGISNSFYIDYASTPLREIDVIYTNPDESKRIEKGSAQSTYQAFYSIGLDLRLNLAEPTDEFALALSSPVGIGFGQSFSPNEDVAGAQGFGNIQIPLMLRGYYGAHSTYQSSTDFGLSLGAGLEFNKIGIVSFESDEQIRDINKPWVMPVAIIGAHFYRGSAPMEVSLKYGFGGLTEYFVDENGSPLTGISQTTRASSLKLNFTYLLNY